MFRICLCLLIVVASSTVAAREIKLSSANSGSCPESAALVRETPRATPHATAPQREAKARPTVHGDATGPRMQSPRWHSFLPGMFR
ncbi:hypothetical protein QLQ15_06985 [Lysobacter sp. LF1]|uniref:Secreted protein n=1 Tax=Lysobacter stagni TaxID=3045172 RepID=A0ABT6XEU6_9GAMM|nr:hypothetical protein [Lysobacter sp. LF1]MDI9238658.1 hypothetical protein [Lysobacter sp. LF1]